MLQDLCQQGLKQHNFKSSNETLLLDVLLNKGRRMCGHLSQELAAWVGCKAAVKHLATGLCSAGCGRIIKMKRVPARALMWCL